MVRYIDGGFSSSLLASICWKHYKEHMCSEGDDSIISIIDRTLPSDTCIYNKLVTSPKSAHAVYVT